MNIGDIKYYKITTGYSSKLLIRFQLTGFYDQEEHKNNFPVGNAVITGFSKLVNKDINFGGMCWLPEVGGNVAVAVIGKDKYGMNEFATEPIIDIKEIEEWEIATVDTKQTEECPN